jgi:hypothetical protein
MVRSVVIRVVGVNGSLTRVIDDGTPTGRIEVLPQVASEISYNVEVYTPNGWAYIPRIKPSNDRPPSPLYTRPVAVGSYWTGVLVGVDLRAIIVEQPAFGPCTPVVAPPPTGPETLPPAEIDPRYIPARSPMRPIGPVNLPANGGTSALVHTETVIPPGYEP